MILVSLNIIIKYNKNKIHLNGKNWEYIMDDALL